MPNGERSLYETGDACFGSGLSDQGKDRSLSFCGDLKIRIACVAGRDRPIGISYIHRLSGCRKRLPVISPDTVDRYVGALSENSKLSHR